MRKGPRAPRPCWSVVQTKRFRKDKTMKRTMMMLGAVMAWVWGVYGAKLHGIDLFHTPGCSMARDRRHAKAESAKGGWQHPPAYAILRIWLCAKTTKLSTEAEYVRCVACVNHTWRVFNSCFCKGAWSCLAQDMDLQARHVLFSRLTATCLSKVEARRRNKNNEHQMPALRNGVRY